MQKDNKIIFIDCSNTTSIIALSCNENIVSVAYNKIQNEHASFAHVSLDAQLKKANWQIKDVNYCVVGNGPGSYTGLRVALAMAKGICFSLQIPLVLINTLDILAAVAQEKILEKINSISYNIIAMIDARRMEVFMATYTSDLKYIDNPTSYIITPTSFIYLLNTNICYFIGNANDKLVFTEHKNKVLLNYEMDEYLKQLVKLGLENINALHFADINYSEPFYTKQAFINVSKK